MSVPDTMGVPGAPSNATNPFGDAAAATRAMIESANAEPAAPPNTPAQDAPPVDTTTIEGTTAAEATTPTPLSWDEIDLSVLPEDARKVVQEGYLRHSDYTRKTQELAEQRKQYESYGDPEAVRAAVDFAQSLNDPSNLLQLKAEIEEHLASLGTPAATPQAQLTDTPNTSGLDPAIQREIAELKQFKADLEHQREEALLVEQMQQKLQSSEDAIRADYPTYTQADIDKIYELSPAHGYDLFAAQQQYEQMRQYFTESLVGNKGKFPDAANNVRSDTLVHQPEDMTTMDAAKKATASLFSQ